MGLLLETESFKPAGILTPALIEGFQTDYTATEHTGKHL